MRLRGCFFPAVCTCGSIIDGDALEKGLVGQRRHRMTDTGRSSIFSGAVCCVDCGADIYVDAANKSSGEGEYIQVKYDGLEFIPLNEQMKEETA